MKMKDQENLARAGAILIAAGVVGLNYLRVKRTEEKKREKIQAWAQEGHACIQNYRDTMAQVIQDPNISIEEIWRRYREESAFLNIVTNQPPY